MNPFRWPRVVWRFLNIAVWGVAGLMAFKNGDWVSLAACAVVIALCLWWMGTHDWITGRDRVG